MDSTHSRRSPEWSQLGISTLTRPGFVDAESLEAVPYFGRKGVENYGLELLGIIRNYMKEQNLQRPETVSYTHLDVYKRQEESRPDL